MHHLYPSLKGDQLCPLGFHPQTRYPTRCKRCFRDYREHGSKKGLDEVSTSSPNLTNGIHSALDSKSWGSTQNLTSVAASPSNNIAVQFNVELKKRPQSWASTPDVRHQELVMKGKTPRDPAEENNVNVTVKLPITLPKPSTSSDTKNDNVLRPKPPKIPKELKIQSNDTLAERVWKMNMIKKQRSLNLEDNVKEEKPRGISPNPSVDWMKQKKNEDLEPPPAVPAEDVSKKRMSYSPTKWQNEEEEASKKKPPPAKEVCTAAEASLKEEINALRNDLKMAKSRMERAEREKSDILLERLALKDRTPNRTAASEALQLQKKVNELNQQIETLTQENKQLENKVRRAENGPENVSEIKNKLKAAEQICIELIEENKQVKKEITNLQMEMEELQDTFREDDTKCNINLQKELDKATKNCRILSFKLRKYEKRIQLLESNSSSSFDSGLKSGKMEAGTNSIIQGENGCSRKPADNELVHSNSKEMEIRDFVERELDLKDQLKFAEDEVENLRKKVIRLEDENDSLSLQIKTLSCRSKAHQKGQKTLCDHCEGSSDEDLPNNTQAKNSELLQSLANEKKNNESLTLAYSKISDENSSLKKLLCNLESERTLHIKHKAEIDEQLKKVTEKLQQTEEELKKLKVKKESSLKINKLNEQLKTLTQDLQASYLKVKEYEQKIQSQEKIIKNLNAAKPAESEDKTIAQQNQLAKENKSLAEELATLKTKVSEMDLLKKERAEFAKKLKEAQNQIKELRDRVNLSGHIEHEKLTLKNKLEERNHEIERLKSENEMNINLGQQLKKENEDLNRKLSDFHRIELAQTSLKGHNATLEEEIKSLKTKLKVSDKQRKSDVLTIKTRYEQQVKSLKAELMSLESQSEQYKIDRDSLKESYQAAQKKLEQMKSSSVNKLSRSSVPSSDEDDKSKILYLEKQIGDLEEQLLETRFSLSRAKIELASERSSKEIKVSEMQSKLNELAEERVIGSGRTKIPGVKTKLELSWQKEREEQQRLLQETSTLARDLRQTLFEVERERDKERIETKRKLEQIKKTNDDELEEGRRKISDLQCDLLELREVHAKLRTTNEKLRKERDKCEREYSKWQDYTEKLFRTLLQTIDETVQTSQKTFSQTAQYTIDPTTFDRLMNSINLFKNHNISTEFESERLRARRMHLKKAASQDVDGQYSDRSSMGRQTSKDVGIMMKKSLSLDTSLNNNRKFWNIDKGSVSSIMSVQSDMELATNGYLDSRLSEGSTQSDIPKHELRKKKSLIGKLRNFGKANRGSDSQISVQESDSDLSIVSESRSSRKDIRNRISGIFKRSGPSSRSNSEELVSSIAKPVAVTIMNDTNKSSTMKSIEKAAPKVYLSKPPPAQ